MFRIETFVETGGELHNDTVEWYRYRPLEKPKCKRSKPTPGSRPTASCT